MKILKSLMIAFLGSIFAFTAMIVLYAKVPAFKDALKGAVNSPKTNTTQKADTKNDISYPSIPQQVNNEPAKEEEYDFDDLVRSAVTDYPSEQVEADEPVYVKEPIALDSNTIPVSDSEVLSIGDIAQVGKFYIGLAYAKRMSYLPTALGEEEVKAGNEVIILFFDVYNSGNSREGFWDDRFTGYADGEQVNEVETYIKVVVDGVEQYHSYDLDVGTQAMTCINYEVPKGWNELRVFYKDGTSWSIKSNQVSTEAYKFTPLIKVNNSRPITNVGDVIYNENYKITYQGHESYIDDNILGEDYYEIFKFRIDNTSRESIDYSLTGYNMICYADNYYIDSPSYSLDEKFDKYINIYDIDSIAPGMSANVYLAFEKKENRKNSSYYVVYDTGYIIDDKLTEVYIEE